MNPLYLYHTWSENSSQDTFSEISYSYVDLIEKMKNDISVFFDQTFEMIKSNFHTLDNAQRYRLYKKINNITYYWEVVELD